MKLLFLMLLLPVILFYSGCKNDPDPGQSYDAYRKYVIAHRDSPDKYMQKTWVELDKEYSDKKLRAEMMISRWNDEMKIEFLELQSDWDLFREDFEAETERRANLEKSSVRVTTVLPTGIDESLSNVNTYNVVGVFRHFVAYVEKEGNRFSPQQWDQIEALWNRLAKRYENLDASISRAEKAAISEQKIRYELVTTINKPVARMEDEEE
jgi:hypothetical protein